MDTMHKEANLEDLLFVGTHGHVLALHKESGRTIWSTSLPRTGYSIVSIIVEDGLLLCATGGRVFALDPVDGWIRWTNDLPGLGHGLVYLATTRTSPMEDMSLLAGQRGADAAAGS